MKLRTVLFVILALLLASPPVMAAEEVSATDEEELVWGVGARVGGYGFREEKEGSLSWEDCRMNGTGVFGTVDVTRHFFAELSTDLYHATGETMVDGMDRMSLHALASAGARMAPDFIVTPYIQVGAGPEWTNIEIAGVSRDYLLAAAFMGVGGELNLGRFKLGSNLRVFTMGHPEHSHAETTRQALGPDGAAISVEDYETEYEVAGQLQFLLRYTF